MRHLNSKGGQVQQTALAPIMSIHTLHSKMPWSSPNEDEVSVLRCGVFDGAACVEPLPLAVHELRLFDHVHQVERPLLHERRAELDGRRRGGSVYALHRELSEVHLIAEVEKALLPLAVVRLVLVAAGVARGHQEVGQPVAERRIPRTHECRGIGRVTAHRLVGRRAALAVREPRAARTLSRCLRAAVVLEAARGLGPCGAKTLGFARRLLLAAEAFAARQHPTFASHHPLRCRQLALLALLRRQVRQVLRAPFRQLSLVINRQ
mmetsp:Transcript_40517/g.100767  ORF Transcript_40517/g.100767 Transcript_40517/m.100767 type:complete len:264 (-) Transcript_40517:75-866(-)